MAHVGLGGNCAVTAARIVLARGKDTRRLEAAVRRGRVARDVGLTAQLDGALALAGAAEGRARGGSKQRKNQTEQVGLVHRAVT